MDQYFIHDVLEDYCVEINEHEFKQLQEAKNNLFSAFVLEERLGFILTNYAEIEKEAFNLTLDYVMTGYEWDKHRNLSNNLNLKVFNLLSTHQFYIDTLPSIFNSIYGKNSGEYKVIENKNLRNMTLIYLIVLYVFLEIMSSIMAYQFIK